MDGFQKEVNESNCAENSLSLLRRRVFHYNGLPVCAVRERINRYIIKGFRVPVQEWYFPVASCNNGFMLTAPEIFGIVTAAEKNSFH